MEGAVDLRVIAECVETPVDDIQLLNPELRRLATPANRTFDVRVPRGQRRRPSAGAWTTLPAEKRVRFRTHVVARGQTLACIARQYGVRARDIAEANGLLRSSAAWPWGTELIIPIDPRAKAAPARRRPHAPAPRCPPRPPTSSGTAASASATGSSPATPWPRSRPSTAPRSASCSPGTACAASRIAAGDTLTIYTETAKN